MRVEKINFNNSSRVLGKLFYGDDDWINNYQEVSGHPFNEKGLKKVVHKTVQDMKLFENYEFYVIYKDNIPVAYFGKEVFQNIVFMTGFYIKIKYRTKEFILYFWNMVEKTINHNPTYCNIMRKNESAKRFLLKKGNLLFDKNDILTFKIF